MKRTEFGLEDLKKVKTHKKDQNALGVAEKLSWEDCDLLIKCFDNYGDTPKTQEVD